MILGLTHKGMSRCASRTLRELKGVYFPPPPKTFPGLGIQLSSGMLACSQT